MTFVNRCHDFINKTCRIVKYFFFCPVFFSVFTEVVMNMVFKYYRPLLESVTTGPAEYLHNSTVGCHDLWWHGRLWNDIFSKRILYLACWLEFCHTSQLYHLCGFHFLSLFWYWCRIIKWSELNEWQCLTSLPCNVGWDGRWKEIAFSLQ